MVKGSTKKIIWDDEKKSIGKEAQKVGQKKVKKLIYDDDDNDKKKPTRTKKIIYDEGKHKKWDKKNSYEMKKSPLKGKHKMSDQKKKKNPYIWWKN